MKNVLPKYVRPIAKIDDPINKIECWDTAIEAFDEKDYKKSIIAVINYINPTILEDKEVTGDIDVVKMQGSAQIHIKVTDTTFSVRAPFIRITDKTNKVALLRKVAEVNFTPLRMIQIHLKNDALCFEYETPIELTQPNKIYDVLRNIAVFADDYDDMFISKYHAEFYKRPSYKALSDTEKEEVWQQISDILEGYTEYAQFFKEKRWDDFIWDLLVISFLKISNMPYVNGKLRSDLIEYIGLLFNGDIDYNFRVDKGVNFMKKIQSKSKEDIMRNVYHAEQFTSLRWRSSQQIISDRLKHNKQQVEKYEKEENNFNASYYLQFVFLKLIYDFNLDDQYKQAIYAVLEEVSGQEPSEAAPKLIKVFYKMLDGTINEQPKTEKTKKGFFSKLFN